jgi:hypothetical protein
MTDKWTKQEREWLSEEGLIPFEGVEFAAAEEGVPDAVKDHLQALWDAEEKARREACKLSAAYLRLDPQARRNSPLEKQVQAIDWKACGWKAKVMPVPSAWGKAGHVKQSDRQEGDMFWTEDGVWYLKIPRAELEHGLVALRVKNAVGTFGFVFPRLELEPGGNYWHYRESVDELKRAAQVSEREDAVVALIPATEETRELFDNEQVRDLLKDSNTPQIQRELGSEFLEGASRE